MQDSDCEWRSGDLVYARNNTYSVLRGWQEQKWSHSSETYLHISGGNASAGNTRSHTEHEG